LTDILRKIRLLVRIPGFEIVQEISVLDDTGSSYLDLFIDDCLRLGLDRFNIPQPLDCGSEWLMTAGGQIEVRKVLVELQIIAADDTVIGEPFLTKAVLPNEFSGYRSRCSGQGLRRRLFTATAPGAIVINSLPAR
jgi:hypothetical protein